MGRRSTAARLACPPTACDLGFCLGFLLPPSSLRLPTSWVILLDNWCQRPERLLVGAQHVPGDVAEQGGLEEILSKLMPLPAGHHSSPFGKGITHVFLHL